MASEVSHIAQFDGEIIARLPLEVEGVVDGVGQFVGAVVNAEGNGLAVVDTPGPSP